MQNSWLLFPFTTVILRKVTLKAYKVYVVSHLHALAQPRITKS